MEVRALIKTAAAAKSLIFLINLCFSGDIKSQIFSIEELMIPIDITTPIESIIASHSKEEIQQ